MPCAKEFKQHFEKNGERRRNVQFVLFKNKIYLFDVQQLLLYEVLGVKMKRTLQGGKRENLRHIVRRASMKR